MSSTVSRLRWARPDAHEDAVVVEADAAVAVVVDDLEMLERADAMDQLLFELRL